jgi:hypothetical protein
MSGTARADWPEYPESDEDMYAGARTLARQFAVVLPVVLCVATPLAAADGAAGGDTSMTAGEALSRLKSGNDRFSHDAALGQAVDSSRRAVLAKGQSPFAMVLSCADSRVTPEDARLAAAIKANVDLVIDDMLRSSATLRTLVHDHKLQLVGAYYELASGKVLFSKHAARSDRRPAQARARQAGGQDRERTQALIDIRIGIGAGRITAAPMYVYGSYLTSDVCCVLKLSSSS